MKKNILFIVLFVLLGVGGFAQNGEYVDLGLPSGTKWKTVNEKGFHTFEKALDLFGKEMPTKAQWEELKEKCKWTWVEGANPEENGYYVKGPNGKRIFLPAAGGSTGSALDRLFDGRIGVYWSSTFYEEDSVWGVNFTSGTVEVMGIGRKYGRSVRLVKN